MQGWRIGGRSTRLGEAGGHEGADEDQCGGGGEVGMAPTSGAMKRERKKRIPVTMAVTPVRPPAATPAERFDVAGDGAGAGERAEDC